MSKIHLSPYLWVLPCCMCVYCVFIYRYVYCMYGVHTMWRRPTEYGIQLHSSEDLGLTRWTAFQWCWKLNKHLSRREQVTNDIGLHNFMNSIAMLASFMTDLLLRSKVWHLLWVWVYLGEKFNDTGNFSKTWVPNNIGVKSIMRLIDVLHAAY